MDVRERELWGRVASAEGKSFGEWFREKLLEWAKEKRPVLAMAVEDVRRRRAEVIRTGAATFMLVLQLLVAGKEMLPDSDDFRARRPSKGGAGRFMRELRAARNREIES